MAGVPALRLWHGDGYEPVPENIRNDPRMLADWIRGQMRGLLPNQEGRLEAYWQTGDPTVSLMRADTMHGQAFTNGMSASARLQNVIGVLGTYRGMVTTARAEAVATAGSDAMTQILGGIATSSPWVTTFHPAEPVAGIIPRPK